MRWARLHTDGELGAEQLAWWAKGIGRAMDFRKKFGDDRFVDVSFADLQTDSVKTVALLRA